MSEKEYENIIEFKTIDEAKPQIKGSIKYAPKLTYDEDKLKRLMVVFDSLITTHFPKKTIHSIFTYQNLDTQLHKFNSRVLNQVYENDETLFTTVFLFKILDRLNAYKFTFDDGTFFMVSIYKLLKKFRDYFKNSDEKLEILRYINEEVNLNKFNSDILSNLVPIVSDLEPDNRRLLREYYLLFKKLSKALNNYQPNELSELAHMALSKLVKNFIDFFMTAGMPFEVIYENLKTVQHHYGAQAPILHFLLTNQKIDLAYETIKAIKDYKLPLEMTELLPLEVQKAMAYGFFCYFSLCYDKIDYFKEFFPEYLKLGGELDEIYGYLLLFLEIVGKEEFDEYMNNLLVDKSLDDDDYNDLIDILDKIGLRFD